LDAQLEIGLGASLHVREERLSDRDDACQLLYVSDVHLRHGRSELLARQVVESAEHCEPQVILLGGDLVDSASELEHLTELTAQLSAVGRVLAIGGNHDDRVGIDRVRTAIERGGGNWIHDSYEVIVNTSRSIVVSGPNANALPDGDVQILCAHNPRIWRTAKHQGYDLVLAGHLHGCQVVAFEFRDRLFPGAAFYPYNFLNHQRGSTRLIVSRGVSDLIPIRWRCPREVVLCYV
jgi:predicted MPP superfamily phosphohydrolase